MHEASLMRDLMRKVLETAAAHRASRVTVVRVRLGALSHMSAGHFCEHFEQASRDTIAHGARIEAIEDSDMHSPSAADVVLESVELQ